jgi:hypothetical protein
VIGLPGEETAGILRAPLVLLVQERKHLVVEEQQSQEAVQEVVQVQREPLVLEVLSAVAMVAAVEEGTTEEALVTAAVVEAAPATPTALTYPPGRG